MLSVQPLRIAVAIVALWCGVDALGQPIIDLNSVIGPSGTDAASVAAAGSAVNFVGFTSDGGATTLTAAGSTGSSAFNFNTGFTDAMDRSVGANPNSGAAHVFADRKYDSGTPSALILDFNGDTVFNESVVPGFGMHGDGFVTFDLAVIRADNGLPADTPFVLTGAAGLANAPYHQTSAAIVADSAELAVFDWTSANNTVNAFSISISGSTRYLTFVGLSGLDQDMVYAHVGYANVQLTAAVPEPSTLALLALGGFALVAWRRRKLDVLVKSL